MDEDLKKFGIEETQVIKVQDDEDEPKEEDEENEEEEEEEKKPKKKRTKRLSKVGMIFFRLIFVISVGVAAYSGINLYKGLKDYRESESAYTALASETKSEEKEVVEEETGTVYKYDTADFTSLAQINSDVAGWLSLQDTVINYPVVQGTDNEYYLEHLFTRELNHTGCIFIDYRNRKDFSDRNTALYAHHMRNGSMFAELEGYRDQSYYDSHKELILQTPDGVYLVQPFAGLLADGSTDYIQFDFPTNESFMTYVNDMIAKSTFVSDVIIEPTDRIITMSTCRYDVADGRYAVFAKLVKMN
jgi:sortase B